MSGKIDVEDDEVGMIGLERLDAHKGRGGGVGGKKLVMERELLLERFAQRVVVIDDEDFFSDPMAIAVWRHITPMLRSMRLIGKPEGMRVRREPDGWDAACSRLSAGVHESVLVAEI